MVWAALAIGACSGFFYWLGLRDGRAGRGGVAAGSRAAGVLVFFGIVLGLASPMTAPLALIPAGAYLAAWAIHRGRPVLHTP
jgi:hypothetical protein